MRGIVVFLLAMSLVGCASVSLGTIRTKNRESLARLSVGMSKDEALQVMGNKTVAVKVNILAAALQGAGEGMRRSSGTTIILRETGTKVEPEAPRRINNPYRVEAFKGKDGHIHEVLYYYTDLKKDDGVITNDELTPIVLKDGKVVGWGWGFLNENVTKYQVQIDVR